MGLRLLHLSCFEHILADGTRSFRASYCLPVNAPYLSRFVQTNYIREKKEYTHRSLCYVNRRQQGPCSASD